MFSGNISIIQGLLFDGGEAGGIRKLKMEFRQLTDYNKLRTTIRVAHHKINFTFRSSNFYHVRGTI